MFQHLGAAKSALPLVFRHLVNAMELLEQPLLVALRETREVGIVAQGTLLLLHRLAAMLIEPVAKMSGGSGVLVVIWPDLRAERGGWSAVRLAWVTRANRVWITASIAILGITGRPALICRSRSVGTRILGGPVLGRSRGRRRRTNGLPCRLSRMLIIGKESWSADKRHGSEQQHGALENSTLNYAQHLFQLSQSSHRFRPIVQSRKLIQSKRSLVSVGV